MAGCRGCGSRRRGGRALAGATLGASLAAQTPLGATGVAALEAASAGGSVAIGGAVQRLAATGDAAQATNDDAVQADFKAGVAAWGLGKSAGVAVELLSPALSKAIQGAGITNAGGTGRPRYVPTGENGEPLSLPRGPNGELAPSSMDAHTQIGWQVGRRGGYIQTREFGANGQPVKQVDWTNHGRPGQHTDPHVHDFLPNPSGGTPQLGPARPPGPGEF